jgi:hypothetical protein
MVLGTFAVGTGCTADPFADYRLATTWFEGDACGVAAGDQLVVALTQSFELSCAPDPFNQYYGSGDVLAAFTDAPDRVTPLDIPPRDPQWLAIHQVRASGPWSVGLVRHLGVMVDRFTAPDVYTRVAEVAVGFQPETLDLEVAGSFAYVGTDQGWFVVALDDVPGDAAVIPAAIGAPARDASVDGDLAAVIVGNDLVLVDVADPRAPVEVGRLVVPMRQISAVGLHDGYAYLVSTGTLLTVDVRDPSAPAWVDDEGSPAFDMPITAVAGDRLLHARGIDLPLAVTDLSNPRRPETRESIGAGDGTFDVAMVGDTLYLATGQEGVQVWTP